MVGSPDGDVYDEWFSDYTGVHKCGCGRFPMCSRDSPAGRFATGFGVSDTARGRRSHIFNFLLVFHLSKFFSTHLIPIIVLLVLLLQASHRKNITENSLATRTSPPPHPTLVLRCPPLVFLVWPFFLLETNAHIILALHKNSTHKKHTSSAASSPPFAECFREQSRSQRGR